MIDPLDPLIEIVGKTGKQKKVHLSDIEPKEHIIHNDVNGLYEPYITRWYRLPGEYYTEAEAYNAIMEFMKKYYCGGKYNG